MVNMLDRKLMRDVWHLRGQVVTIALVVASGIAAFSASLSTYEALKRMQAEYYESARFAQVFATARRVPTGVAPRVLELPGVAAVAATLSYDVLLDLPGVVEPTVGRIIALPEHGLPAMNRLTLMAGRWIDAPESNQVLVNQTFADKRGLKPGSTLRALLNGKREQLEVVGIVLSPEYIFPAAHGVGDDASFGIFWIGRKRLAAAFNMEGAFNRVAVRLAHGASEGATIDRLDRLLETYGSTGAYGRDEQPSHKAITQEIAEMRVFGLVLPSVFLGVAVFLLNVVLTRQIGTQRGQIAVLKALGYPNARIGLHYLKFVLVIVLLGVVMGLSAGAWLGRLLTELYAEFFHFPTLDFELPLWVVAYGALASLVAAVAGALRALQGVVRLAPATAMQPPSPPTFRRTVAERFGLGRLYSPAVRMVLRDMERRPGRALATTLGIAGAVAILISGTWWRDAIDYLFEVEFRMRERQDVSLVLAEPASDSAVYELMRLPGVLRAEIDRSAPVRLVYGHRSYRTTLTGLPSGATLRLLLDDDLRDVPLPDEGLVINRTLADLLAVRPGDRVRVEMLQGARKSLDVPVVALVADLMGTPAFMHIDALNRLLGEGDAMSGARLRLDAAERVRFLQQVKEIPRVAFAVEIGPIIRNFRETSARNILIFTTVLSVLAATIAFGVVYNNARIALAERAWELASLRVLGMTRSEVSWLLLGELGLQLLVAVPIGWLAGYGLSAFIVELIHPETFRIPLIIEPRTYAFAALVVLGAGVASALIVRRRVDRLDLVAVLKTRE